MQITVFGASGKVGSLVVEEALKRGFTVSAFVHRHNLFAPNGNLGIVKGDIYNASDIDKALRGSSAVVSCLGSWGTPKRNVLTTATRAIIPAMAKHHITRLITLTGSGAAAPGERGHPVLLKMLAPFPAGKVFRDGEAHMQLLAASELGWTTLRSPIMTNGRNAAYRLGMATAGATVPRAAVAVAIVDQLEATDYLHQAPLIHRG